MIRRSGIFSKPIGCAHQFIRGVALLRMYNCKRRGLNTSTSRGCIYSQPQDEIFFFKYGVVFSILPHRTWRSKIQPVWKGKHFRPPLFRPYFLKINPFRRGRFLCLGNQRYEEQHGRNLNLYRNLSSENTTTAS